MDYECLPIVDFFFIFYFLFFFAGPHDLNRLNFEGRPPKNNFLPLAMRWLPLILFSVLKETYILCCPQAVVYIISDFLWTL